MNGKPRMGIGRGENEVIVGVENRDLRLRRWWLVDLIFDDWESVRKNIQSHLKSQSINQLYSLDQ